MKKASSRPGAARLDAKATGLGVALGGIFFHGVHASVTKTKAYYGLGLDYAFKRDLSAGIEGTRYHDDGDRELSVPLTLVAVLRQIS